MKGKGEWGGECLRSEMCERETACRDQGRRNQVQTGGSNEREELKLNWTEKINTEK